MTSPMYCISFSPTCGSVGKERLAWATESLTSRSVAGAKRRWALSATTERARAELGWEPRVDSQEGAKRYVEWYRKFVLPVERP